MEVAPPPGVGKKNVSARPLRPAHIPGLHHAKLSKKLTFAVGYLSKPYLEQGKAVKEQQFTLHDVPVKVLPCMPSI